jgi:hypothetical protein
LQFLRLDNIFQYTNNSNSVAVCWCEMMMVVVMMKLVLISLANKKTAIVKTYTCYPKHTSPIKLSPFTSHLSPSQMALLQTYSAAKIHSSQEDTFSNQTITASVNETTFSVLSVSLNTHTYRHTQTTVHIS